MTAKPCTIGILAVGLVLLASTFAAGAQQPARGSGREVPPPEDAGPVAPLDVTTLSAIADAYVDSASPTTNYGGVTPLYVGNQTTSAIDRALYRFDLSTLPPGVIIDSATLRVYMSQAPSGPPLVVDIGAYRITSSWTESGVAWGNQPSVLPIGQVTGVSMTLQTYEWEVTGLAQDWLANPATNFGVALRSEIEGTVGWRAFASREAAAASRPQLVVEYHLPPCTDPQEPNDTFVQAFLIIPGVEYAGCIPTPSDLDYFRFDVAPNTAIQVELYSLPANYDLYLYAPGQSLLDSSVNGGTTSEMVAYTTGPTGGQFYAKVQGGGEWDLYNPYALKLTLTPVMLWPDLVVNDVWSQGSQVCYEIENIGQATAPQGHYTSLTVDGVLSATHVVTDDLAPGAKMEGCFEYRWLCTVPQDEIAVCADHGTDVAESNEANNCTEETWPCDTTPPKIISGPTISSVTSISATVSWTTDEASDSTVRFGRKAGMFEGEKTDSGLTQAHAVVLTGLQPSATYRYVVSSTDAAGNAIASREAFFTTEPPTGAQPPSISDVILTRMPGKPIYYSIAAAIPTGAYVERVEFTMDGKLLGKAYAPLPNAPPGLFEFPLIPAALNIPREDFFTDHIVEAVAVGSGGMTGRFPVQFNPPYECADIHVEMDYPFPDYTLYFDNGALPPGTIVPIEVHAWSTSYNHCRFIVDLRDRFACEIEAQSIERTSHLSL